MKKGYDRPLLKLTFCPNVDIITASNVDDTGLFNSNWINIAN